MQQKQKPKKFGDRFREVIDKLPAPGSGDPEMAAAWKKKYGRKDGEADHNKAGLTPLGRKLVGKVREITDHRPRMGKTR